MFLKTYRVYLMGPLCLMFAGQPAKAQTDSLFLSVDQLFERGVQHSLQLQADALKEAMAQERTRTARTSDIPYTFSRTSYTPFNSDNMSSMLSMPITCSAYT